MKFNSIACILAVCYCSLATLETSAQNLPFEQAYKDYIAINQKLSTATTFIVLQHVEAKGPDVFAPGIQVLRQLNDSVFIIRDITGRFNSVIKIPANHNWKLSPALLQKLQSKLFVFPNSFVISSDDFSSLQDDLQHKVFFLLSTNIRLAKNISNTEFQKLLANEHIHFLAEYHDLPVEELQINNLDLSANRINLLHSNYPGYKGEGLVVSIKENKPDSTDIDLKGRYITNPLESSELSPHATIMATMAAGAGNSYYLGTGVARGAGITSSSFTNLFPDTDQQYKQFHISVQNHSYGVGIENFYGADAAAFDESAGRNDSVLFVFSAGNSGLQTSTSGNYSGLSGFANLTGSFKMAKNILTAGATDSFGVIAPQSSKGPAFDGRLKPELVAYGEDGSSGAAALVSGTAIILQEAYKKKHNNISPSSELVRAILLNTCDDVGRPGIDFSSGYGALNANRAMKEMLLEKYRSGNFTANGIVSFPIQVPSNIRRLKVLLTWQDPAAAPNAFKAIVNDLDLSVKSPSGAETWLPWVLNSTPVADSLLLLPMRKRDSLNNIEQVTIDNPIPGIYNVVINAFNLRTANQSFVLSVVLDTTNYFEWNFPAAGDNIFPGIQNLIRWKSTYSSALASLDYSVDQGTSWHPIDSSVDLSSGYYRWNAPDTISTALLRMTVDSGKYVSDTFSISSRLNIRVGFNCKDSIMLFWNKLKGADSYQLYGLGNKFLEAFTSTRDTQAIVLKNSQVYSQFAVAPVLKSTLGLKSYTIDYATQGVACYISNLTADLRNGNTALIHLITGTAFNVSQIIFEKLIAGKYTSIKTFDNVSSLDFSYLDPDLVVGGNVYRAAVLLKDGQVVYSDPTTVIYLSTFEFLAYPNPLHRGSNITIQFKDLHNQIIKFIDGSGRAIMTFKAVSTTFTSVILFPAGIYFLQVADPELHTSKTIKVIIL